MEAVSTEEGRYEQKETESSFNSYVSSSTSSNAELSNESSDDEDVKVDLQKIVPDCFKSDLNISLHTNGPNDDEFQAAALCQFMDILNDLDKVLDKSLLACLDDGTAVYDSDEEDIVCKSKTTVDNVTESQRSHSESQEDDDAVVTLNTIAPMHQTTESIPLAGSSVSDRNTSLNMVRSKSFTDLSEIQREAFVSPIDRNNPTNNRNSMRQLDPIVLPALAADEPLTLPVILFLDHVNMRPTSAPIQLQVTAANLSSDGSSGPLIVGRRALLMNRTLSLPSRGESDVTGGWNDRNTSRSTARSSSASSSSTESLAAVMPSNVPPSAQEDSNNDSEPPPFGVWPHRMSAMLACLSCTVGIFNLSRFAVLSVHFGASFIIQFLILSFLIGIPLFTLHLCLGHVLAAGPVDMWKISPIFQGVGICLLLIQAVIGIYSMIGLSWIFVYFRDAFINADDKYKWALPHEYSFEDAALKNGSFRIQDTIPQYFYGEVLQQNLSYNNSYFGTIKFQVAFNLAVVWMIVFVALSKGLRSYGKAVYILMFLPICGTLILCTKLLTLIPYDAVTNIFSETEWSEFFINSNSWAAATQEIFLTWGLLGACVMQLSSHKNTKRKSSTVLQRESACVIAFTLAMLLLAAFLANTCVQVLKNYGYFYAAGSFESVQSSQFLYPTSEPLPGNMASTPMRYMGHYSSLVGFTVWKTGNIAKTISGWQPLQLATQIVPATLAVLPPFMLSPAWAVIFYFVLIMFGIAQQLAIWHCVIAGIMAINAPALRVWETTITFLSCVCGLALGLVLCTDAGIRIVHYVDYVWVGAWWQCGAQVALVCGVFAVRGRPYSADVVVAALYENTTRLAALLRPLLAFAWTVVQPVTLCVICVVDFRAGNQRQMYTWRKPSGYWPIWSRQVAVLMQQGTLLVITVAAFVQTWRYMSKGPPDILDRIQALYRPRIAPAEPGRVGSHRAVGARPAPPPDPPPKYTPPPSYSTATAARLLNTVRRSFRTLRRVTTSRPESQLADTSQLPITLSEAVDRNTDQPPQYVFPQVTITDETDSNRPRTSTSRNSLHITRDILRRSFVRKSDSVKSIRSSLRRSFKYGGGLTTSHEHLVRDAEPISNTVAMSAMLDADEVSHTRSLASVI